MSIEVMTLVFKRSLGSVTKKAVLLAMADAANDDGSGVWKSAETIAGECDVSKRTVLRTWKELEADGLIQRVGVRTVRGGDVIIWGLDCDAISRLSRPGDRLSPSDKESPLRPDDTVSPGDNDDTDPVTMTTKPGDTVSPKPSLNHPIEPSALENLLDEIWKVWSETGRKRSHSREQLLKKLKTKTKGRNLDEVLKAFRVMAKTTDGNFHPGIQVVLNSGQWQNWIGKDPSTEQPMSLEDWKQAAADYCDLQIWPVKLGPAPHQPDCQAPVGLLKTIAKRMQGHAWHSSIIQHMGRAA